MRLDNGQLGGGVEAVVDCVGSADTIAQALRITAPGGTIHAVGMPGVTTVDLTPLWQREISLRGAYAYQRHDFDTAIELVAERDLGRLLTATYPLRSYERSEEHTSELQSLMRISYAVFCLKQKKTIKTQPEKLTK